MFHSLARKLCLAVMVLVLAVVPALVGCGDEGGTTTTEILIGLETDLTGPAQSSIAPVYNGIEDYLKSANAEGAVPGAKIKIVTYDHRTDYSRIPVGYVWLKGKGVKAVMYPSPTDIQMLINQMTDDKLPALGTTILASWMNEAWAFGTANTMEVSSQRCMKWIMEEWDYTGTGRNPKIGFVGIQGSVPTEAHFAGFEAFVNAHADKFDYLGAKFVTSSTSAFAQEVDALRSCDWIFVYFYQTTLTSFVKEARARGYTGNIMSTSASMPGYWNLVRSAVPASELYGCYHVHHMPWCEDVPFATKWRSYMTEYRDAGYVEVEGQSPSYATGIFWAEWLVDVVKRAAENVGAENVDGQAIRDAAETTNMEKVSEGWAADWVLSPTNHVLNPADKMYVWDVDQVKWIRVSESIVL